MKAQASLECGGVSRVDHECLQRRACLKIFCRGSPALPGISTLPFICPFLMIHRVTLQVSPDIIRFHLTLSIN